MREDEKGAVAVLVGILAVFLIGLSAFTIDLGSAYVSNRNLQKAADAGALAGAQSLSKVPGTCNSIRSNSAEVAKAKAIAVEVAKRNYPDGVWTETTWQVTCDAASKSLLVELGDSGTTYTRVRRRVRGTVRGDHGSVGDRHARGGTAHQHAHAPLAMCSTQLTAGPFVRLDYPKDAPPSCGNASGAWWTVDCPGAASNSTSQMVIQVRDGCPNGVSVVSSQSESQTTQQLTTTLEAACLGGATADGGCLGEPRQPRLRPDR